MKKNEAQDFYEALEKLDYYFPSFLEVISKKAQYQREHYNQLVKSGFSEKDALEIIKAQPTPF